MRCARVGAGGSGDAPVGELAALLLLVHELARGGHVGVRRASEPAVTGWNGGVRARGVSALPRAGRWRIRDSATTRGSPPTRCVLDPSTRNISRAYLASKVFFPTETGGTCAGMAFMSRCAMALGLNATGVWFSGDSACIGLVFRRDAGYVRAVAFGLGTSRTTSERRTLFCGSLECRACGPRGDV